MRFAEGLHFSAFHYHITTDLIYATYLSCDSNVRWSDKAYK